MAKAIFITGTGTDIGKTYVSGLLAKELQAEGLRTAYYKPAASGNQRDPAGKLIPGDARQVKCMAELTQPLRKMGTFVYEAPVSPHLAAKTEGNTVETAIILADIAHLKQEYDVVIIEGAGGILCPLRDGDTPFLMADLVAELACPTVLVADAGLGTINTVVLTAAYMKNKNLPLQGLIFNHFQKNNPLHEDNRRMCEKLTGIPTLACVPHHATKLSLSAKHVNHLLAPEEV